MEDVNKLTQQEKIELFSHLIVNPEIWSRLAQQPKKYDKVVDNFNTILNDSKRKAEKIKLDKYNENDLINIIFEIGKTQKSLSQALSQTIIDLRNVDSLIKQNSDIAEQKSEHDINVKKAKELAKIIGKSKCIIENDNIDLFISKSYAEYQYETKIDNDISFVGTMEEIYDPEFQRLLHKSIFEAPMSKIIKDIEYHLDYYKNFIDSYI